MEISTQERCTVEAFVGLAICKKSTIPRVTLSPIDILYDEHQYSYRQSIGRIDESQTGKPAARHA